MSAEDRDAEPFYKGDHHHIGDPETRQGYEEKGDEGAHGILPMTPVSCRKDA
jgi:hypothetical protein